jgi:hypothetical protein
MTTPDWLKPGIYGAICGAVVAAVIGFTWGGWVTGGGAEKMATARSHDAVMLAMVPICIDQSMRDPDRARKLDTIKAATSYKRGDAVMDAGWATLPGMEKPDRDLAGACVDGLSLDS